MEKATIAGLAILLLALGGAALFFMQPGAPRLPFSFTVLPSGFSTLSLTQGTSYISSDPFFSSPAYSLVVAADGSGGSAKGTFTPDDVSSFTGANKPSGPFTIQIDTLNESCTYTLLSGPVKVYTWSLWSGECPYCGSSGCGWKPCNQWQGTFAGELYQIDSVAHYQTSIKVILQANNNTYNAYISDVQKSADIENVMRVNFVGSLVGSQSCPVPSTTTMLFRPVGTNQLIPKSVAYYNTLLTQQNVLINQARQPYGDPPAVTMPAGSTDPNIAQAAYNGMISSVPVTSAYCITDVTSGTETTYKCNPTSPTTIPIIKMVVKASVLKIVVPSSMPKIISVSQPIAQAANTTKFTVTLKNIGNETDSFDIAITGKYPVNIQAPRISLAAGASGSVDVLIQGAGIIGTYTVTVNSVNTPLNKDTYNFKLMIDPFCDRPAEPGKTKVSTEFGCYYICPQSSTDVREKTCEPFGTFEPRGQPYNRSYGSGINQTSEYNYINEYHCTGVGSYMSLNDYMDNILANQQSKFIASPKENAYWMGAPYCGYWAAYGYKMQGGSAVVVEEANYYMASGQPVYAPQNGTLVAGHAPPPSGNGAVMPPSIPPITPPVVPPAQDNSPAWGIGIFTIIILVVGATVLYSRRR